MNPEHPHAYVQRVFHCGLIGTFSKFDVCRVAFPVPPPWSAILVRAESLGVWTMPDQRRLPEAIPTPRDGTSLWVESRARSAYRRFVYTAPYVRLGLRSEYDRAEGLMRLVADVMGLATR